MGMLYDMPGNILNLICFSSLSMDHVKDRFTNRNRKREHEEGWLVGKLKGDM